MSAVAAVLQRLPDTLAGGIPADGAALGSRAWYPDLAGPDGAAGPVYLNHAAIAPPSLLVQAAIQAMMADYARLGVGAVMGAVANRDRLRPQLAHLVGGQAEDIGLVPNTTHGVLAIAHGLDWRAGDRVLCFDGEFPTNVVPWQRAADCYGLELVFESLDDFDADIDTALARVERQLERGVRLVAVSAVQFSTGLAMPVERLASLCRVHGAELFVDAIQAVGVMPMRLRDWGVDYLACGSHKWLMGVEGCGFLAVHPDRVADLVPRIAGWLSVEEPLDFLFSGRQDMRYDKAVRQRPDFVEVGAPNALGFAALEAGVAPLLDLGPAAILAHVQALHDAVEPLLVDRGFTSLRAAAPAARSGSLSMLVPDGVDLAQLVQLLASHGLGVSSPDGRLRLSPHWPNGLDQVDGVRDAVDAALQRLGGA